MDVSLNQQTYDLLKRDIMTFNLMPGEPVSAAKIAERYQVSRTPAREALVKLETEGLIDIFPQSKSVISKINITRAKQEWFVRKTLELGMVDSFFENVTKKDINEMREYCERIKEFGHSLKNNDTSFDYLEYDNGFHAVTYRVAGETIAAEIIKNTMSHYNRIRLLLDLHNSKKDRTVSDHNRLIELAQSGDKDGYREMLSKHLGHIVTDIENIRKLQPELFE